MLSLDTSVSDHFVMVMFVHQSGSSLLKSCQCVYRWVVVRPFYLEPITYIITINIIELVKEAYDLAIGIQLFSRLMRNSVSFDLFTCAEIWF